MLNQFAETKAYIEKHGLVEKMPQASHIIWATGGNLVPASIREEYVHTYLQYNKK